MLLLFRIVESDSMRGEMRTLLPAALAMLAGVTIGGVGVYRLNAQVKPPAYVIGEIDVADPENYAK